MFAWGRKKDSALMEELFTLYRGKMYGVAFAILHNEQQAEDAVGDAFEKLIGCMDRCYPAKSPKTKAFLTCTVKNAAIDIYRKNRKEQGNVSYDEQEYLLDGEDVVDAYIQNTADTETINALRFMLPEHYWNIIQLRYLEELSVGEIAVKLCMTEENVYSRLRRARKKARELLEDVT